MSQHRHTATCSCAVTSGPQNPVGHLLWVQWVLPLTLIGILVLQFRKSEGNKKKVRLAREREHLWKLENVPHYRAAHERRMNELMGRSPEKEGA